MRSPNTEGEIVMKVAIFEVCRNPEIEKQTETLLLSQAFDRLGIDCDVYSNDGIWRQRTFLNRSLLQNCLAKPGLRVVHLALHGDSKGLVMRWSKAEKIRDRRPQEILSPADIEAMTEWRDKLIVSGASRTTALTDSFLAAGAAAVLCPEHPISYQHFLPFSEVFYGKLAARQPLRPALDASLSQFPDLKSFRLFSRRNVGSLTLA